MGKASRRKKERGREALSSSHMDEAAGRASELAKIMRDECFWFDEFINLRDDVRSNGMWGGQANKNPYALPDVWITVEESLATLTVATGRVGALEEDEEDREYLHKVQEPAVMAGAWESTKRVYAFDSDFWGHLSDATGSDLVASTSLRYLPDWAFYGAFPRKINGFCGFWVAIVESRPNKNERTLFVIWDHENPDSFGKYKIHVPLDGQPLSDLLEKQMKQHVNNIREREGWFVEVNWDSIRAQYDLTGVPLKETLAALMYLSSEKPDISGRHIEWSSSRPHMSDLDDTDVAPSTAEYQEQEREQRRKKPSQVVPWKVGVRIGKALRACEQKEKRDRENNGGTGRVVRPHIRRAHWHTYWCGPLNGTRYQRVKWMPPIPVAVNNTDDLPIVVTPVRQVS